MPIRRPFGSYGSGESIRHRGLAAGRDRRFMDQPPDVTLIPRKCKRLIMVISSLSPPPWKRWLSCIAAAAVSKRQLDEQYAVLRRHLGG